MKTNNIFIAKYKNCILEKEEKLVCELLSSESKSSLNEMKLNKKLSNEDQKNYYINYHEVIAFFKDKLNIDLDNLDDNKVFSIIHETLKNAVIIIKSIDIQNRLANIVDIKINVSPQHFYITSTQYNNEDNLKYKFNNSNLYYLDNDKQYKFSFTINFSDTKNFIMYEDTLFVNLSLIINSDLEEVTLDSIDKTNIADIIEGFKNYLLDKKLYFSNLDVDNFCYSVLSNNFVILEGVSGIGKSRLPYEFATYLGLEEQKDDLLFLPISPSYTEPSDILGFYNINSNTYIESETRLVSFLLHASINKDKLHIIILDEMNLSSIEHYFAPFISVLEKTSDRFITLYSDSLEVKNKDKFPSKIELFDNIRIIGTINDDETSTNISQRLLDRALVLNLEVPTFKLNKKSNKNYITNISSLDLSLIESNMDTFEILNENELEFFDALNKVLRIVNKNVLVSYRTLNHIASYKALAEKIENSEYSLYFDLLVRDTILKKLFLNNLTYLNNQKFEELINFLENSKLSPFKYSINYIVEKIDKYE